MKHDNEVCDVTAADLIGADHCPSCGRILTDEDKQANDAALACTCGRGDGDHHPDCPAWDSHVDNYEGEQS